MRRLDGRVVYSATDLMNFLECEHLSALDEDNLDAPNKPVVEDDLARLIQQRGLEHEAEYLAALRDAGQTVIDVSADGSDGSLDGRVASTREAIDAGPHVIYQAALRDGSLAGYADFLERVEAGTENAAHHYEVVDTKLATRPKASYIIQLCFYSSILGKWQGHMPEAMHVVLGDGTRASYPVAQFVRYYQRLLQRFLKARQRDVVDT